MVHVVLKQGKELAAGVLPNLELVVGAEKQLLRGTFRDSGERGRGRQRGSDGWAGDGEGTGGCGEGRRAGKSEREEAGRSGRDGSASGG